MKRPWLSLLMPAHNAMRHLPQTLASVMPQLPADTEMLVLDDGSGDGTWDWLNSEQAPRTAASWRLLRHPQAQGVSLSRNRLLDEARGTWLWFMDADDLMRPGAVQRVRATIEHSQGPLDVVLLDYAVWRERSTLKHRLRGEGHRRTFDGPARVHDRVTLMQGLLARGQWHFWSKVVRADCWPLDLRCPPGRVFEDLAVAPRLLAGCEQAVHLSEPLIDYRSNPGSILGSMNPAKVEDWAQALRLLADHGRTVPPELRKAWVDFLWQQSVRLCAVAQRQGLGADWQRGVSAELQDLEPALPACARAAWKQPTRWSLAWRARQLGLWA